MSRGKGSQEHSQSESKKKNRKSKLKVQTRLALNLWEAYVQKPLESTMKPLGTGRKTKAK